MDNRFTALFRGHLYNKFEINSNNWYCFLCLDEKINDNSVINAALRR